MYLQFLLALSLAYFASSVAINGAQGGVNIASGERPARQELSELTNSGPAFDLYILSLQQFMQQDQSELLSYYQVAGIHGHPYISWDGVKGPHQTGYCTHGSILFPSWHRPYLALFEQILWNNAQQIASTYPTPQQSQYQTAATTFRIPYWDWSLNATMPDPVNDPIIDINTPRGQASVVNPLCKYTFHPQPSAFDFPPSDGQISRYNATVRYPNSSGASQPNLSNKQLQSNAQALHDLTYQLIASQSNYAPFSNTAYSDERGGRYNSIENMHNAIHSLVGQGGHMSTISYSAFDPIFWLHHANVDRLFAIWQAIYPDSYTISEVDKEGTFTNAPGAAEDINTPLTPFHSSNSNTLYTSSTARYTRSFGYTYPEITDWNVNSTQLSSNVRTNLNSLYNPTGSISSRSLPPHSLAKRNTTTTSPSHTNTTASGYQYSINIRISKSALGEPFFIHFFLGPIPSSPLEWSYAPTLVASHSVLYTSSTTTTNTTIPTYGQIPLNHALLRSLPSASLTPITVAALLKHNLSWRVQAFDDRVIDADSEALESLKIFVVEEEVLEEGGGDRLRRYGHMRVVKW